jgi:glycosyltransferase involved in cell wall biosynthesis
VLYVYALVDADGGSPLPAETGHGGAPLCVVARGRVAAICSRHEHIDLAVEAEHLWRHERVAEALMDEHAVLPVRFGTTVADDDALGAMLDERQAEFADALDRVRGRVEMTVKAMWTPPAPPVEPADGGESPGRTYLLGRLETRTAAVALADAIHARLAAQAVDARRQVLVTPRLLLSAAYLVDRRDVDALLAASDDAARRHPEVELLCIGPWPPHTFAQAAGGLG